VSDLNSLKYEAGAIALALKTAFGLDTVADLQPQQVIALAEEVGEFVGAARRYMKLARRPGPIEDVASELADVMITAMVTARVFNIDIVSEIDKKLAIIFERGWKDW